MKTWEQAMRQCWLAYALMLARVAWALWEWGR